MSEATTTNTDDPALPERRSDRDITLSHRVEYGLALLLTGFFRLLGPDLSSAVAGRFMRIVGPRLGKYVQRGERNLQIAFPDWTQQEIRKALADVWENLGRTGAEYAHLDRIRIDGARPRILHSGFDALRGADGKYRQVIFVTGHFANWEVPALCARQLDVPFAVIYRAANNPLVDEMIIRKRAATMTRHQSPKGRRGARAFVDILNKGLSVAMLVDQKLNDGIAAPFFGREAMTAPAAARMAIKYDIPLVPISCERLGGAYFRVTAHAPIEYKADLTGGVSTDVYNVTVRINETLERFIKAQPAQWLWFHRRWPAEKP
ncbi:MAG: lysophospholipid acyltransferase family protein [Hyphococcus sp.]